MITVTLRQKKTNTGNIYLYLDYHPAVFNPRTFKTIRRESLKIKLYADPKNAREKKYNEIMLEKGEAIRCKRQIELVNEQYGFLDKSTRGEDFLDYFYKASLKKSEKWMATYRHFKEFMKGKCTFGALSIGLCDKFKDYLLTAPIGKHKKKLHQNTASAYFCVLQSILKDAYRSKLLQENLNDYLESIPSKRSYRPFLTIEEVRKLKDTPCKIPVLKAASMFSILTGLRRSDIMTLEWSHISTAPDGGPCIIKTIEKSDRVEVNYISEEALSYCGPRSSGLVFKGLTTSMTYTYLAQWVAEAGIDKHVTFHIFRHTNATLLSSAGIDIYTVSRMLNHKNVGTTQIYADIVDDRKRVAANAIKL